jgi:ribosome-associated protein YbcJ (S4-like RNA binding protein)
LTSKNNTEYVAAQIRDGSVAVYWTNNGGKAKKFISSKVVTNGQWHTAVVSKDRRRISLKVDGKVEMDRRKITKKLSVISPLYVGSITDISISNKDMVRVHFKLHSVSYVNQRLFYGN